ncbi:MAG: YceD family protein [Candidatus Sedimenticola sp. (ex Thyasira tokunagai)]
MSSRLPDFVDPWRLANLGKQLSGAVGLGELSRLADALVSVEGESLFTLEFYRDEKKRARIKGNVEAELVLECQRCLEPVTLPVDAEVNLAVIEVAAEAELLPDECDPVMVEEGRIQLLDLIEDELLLAIPQVPMHPQGTCPVEMETLFTNGDFEDVQQESATDEANPFAVLAGLKPDKQN